MLLQNDIHDKYIVPPRTTDFALMFLPTEGLYVEVVQNVTLFEKLRDKYKIMAVGATKLSTFLACCTLLVEAVADMQNQIITMINLQAVDGKF